MAVSSQGERIDATGWTMPGTLTCGTHRVCGTHSDTYAPASPVVVQHCAAHTRLYRVST